MSTQIELAKIIVARFGHGGYQNAQIGLSLGFAGKGIGTSTFKGFWSGEPRGSWDKNHQLVEFGKVVDDLSRLLIEAQVNDVSELIGKPVELTFENGTLKEWRILTEVL